MANTIDTIGNGDGYLYITDVAGTLINSIRNDADGVKRSRSVAVVGAPIATNRSSAGQIIVLGCNSVGNITSITIDGIEQLGAPIPVATNVPATLAVTVAQAINSSTPGSGYKYSAYTQGATVIILAPINAGETPNGYVIVVTVDDVSIDTGVADFDGGVTNTGTYDQQFGVRVWLNNDTLSTPDSIAGAAEITEFITTRGMNSGIPQLDYTAADDALDTVDRWAAIQVINVSPETTADDVLCFIDPRNFMTGDHVVIRNTSDTYALTLERYDFSSSLYPFKNLNLNNLPTITLVNPSDYVELVYRYDADLGGMFDLFEYQVLSPLMITLTWDELDTIITNSAVIEGIKYRITDATEYEIPLIVNGLNATTVSNFAYSEEFPQDEIWYDFATDIITRRTDSIKKLSAPFDWRNKMHTLTKRTFDAEAIGFPCTPVSYSYDGSPVSIATPDATIAGMVFNDATDIIVWIQSVIGGMACRVDGAGVVTPYLLSLYNLGTFDPLFTDFTLNDGADKVVDFEDSTEDFYTFGNTINANLGGGPDSMTPAADGNGGTCYNIWVNDYPGIAVPTVIGEAVRDVRCGLAIINDGAYNIQINYESGNSYFFNYIGGGNNIIADIGDIYQNSAYGGSVPSNIVANVLGMNLGGFANYFYGNSLLTQRTATERTDSSLGLYDYRLGISIQVPTTFYIAFTQTVDRLTENATLLGNANIPEIILKPTLANTLTLTNTAIVSLANDGEIICEDGPITLDGANGDYAVLRPTTLQAYPGLVFWQVTEYHNYA